MFKTVKPWLIANPLLGLTWISNSSGIDNLIPVGTNALPNGCSIISTVEYKSWIENYGLSLKTQANKSVAVLKKFIDI